MAGFIRKILIGILVLVGAPIVLGLVVVLSPVFLFFEIKMHFDKKEEEQKFADYLKRMDGACFFCYNSRKSSVDFARETIVPQLAPTIQVVFVNGKNIEDVPEKQFVSRMLYDVKDRKGFPYLLKIKNGQVLDCSISNQFYGIMQSNKPIGQMLERINSFCHS